jgi:hypothetical protein
MERLTAPRVTAKTSGDRRYRVWKVVSGALALTHARRRCDLDLNPKGILRLMREDDLLCVRPSCSGPVILHLHSSGGPAGSWTERNGGLTRYFVKITSVPLDLTKLRRS